MKKILLTLPLAALLSACGTPSVEDLINNPETLYDEAEKCGALQKQGKSLDTEICQNVGLAMQKGGITLLGKLAEIKAKRASKEK